MGAGSEAMEGQQQAAGRETTIEERAGAASLPRRARTVICAGGTAQRGTCCVSPATNQLSHAAGALMSDESGTIAPACPFP